MTRDAGEISRVRSAADGAEDEHGVLNRTGHGAELIEGPAERHGPGARHTAEGGAQAGNTAAHGRTDDGATGLACRWRSRRDLRRWRRLAPRSNRRRLPRAATDSWSGRRTR